METPRRQGSQESCDSVDELVREKNHSHSDMLVGDHGVHAGEQAVASQPSSDRQLPGNGSLTGGISTLGPTQDRPPRKKGIQDDGK